MTASFCSRLQWQPCCRLYFVPHFFRMCTCSHSQPSVLNQLSPYTFVKLGTRNGSTPSLNMNTNITNLCHVFYHIRACKFRHSANYISVMQCSHSGAYVHTYMQCWIYPLSYNYYHFGIKLCFFGRTGSFDCWFAEGDKLSILWLIM